ncbi:hypothetical protein PIB30_055700 [Stylosanthes scabra]|uniref:Uncharacterized protein n=1 Tax=Stylosanthes scabra TaxID=79078 RepID=A0ABU6VJD3_9FABA|nr:hypothetical protein [Stylosanthes scabra]
MEPAGQTGPGFGRFLKFPDATSFRSEKKINTRGLSTLLFHRNEPTRNPSPPRQVARTSKAPTTTVRPRWSPPSLCRRRSLSWVAAYSSSRPRPTTTLLSLSLCWLLPFNRTCCRRVAAPLPPSLRHSLGWLL